MPDIYENADDEKIIFNEKGEKLEKGRIEKMSTTAIHT